MGPPRELQEQLKGRKPRLPLARGGSRDAPARCRQPHSVFLKDELKPAHLIVEAVSPRLRHSLSWLQQIRQKSRHPCPECEDGISCILAPLVVQMVHSITLPVGSLAFW